MCLLQLGFLTCQDECKIINHTFQQSTLLCEPLVRFYIFLTRHSFFFASDTLKKSYNINKCISIKHVF